MKTSANKIELFANVAIIVTALLISGIVVKRYFFDSQAKPASIIGTRINLPGADWSKNRSTLILALSKDCRFCTQSARFYQRLVKKTASPDAARLIAVFPQSVEESTRYLNETGVSVNDIRQTSLASLGTKGTPTLILINNDGIISDSWIMTLSSEKEAEVQAKL